jgi:broad specificity phosphatase PhoE
MAIIRLVRHGRATGGWDVDPDPGLDVVGVAQAAALCAALGPLGDGRPPRLVTSPLRRCRETVAPLAARWGVAPVVEPRVSEIPTPEGVPFGQRVPWLQAAIAGTWTALGARYVGYRDAVAAYVAGLAEDTVVTTHFVAINAVIGSCIGDDRVLIRRLDNTSVTVVATTPTGVELVSVGDEADTQLR